MHAALTPWCIHGGRAAVLRCSSERGPGRAVHSAQCRAGSAQCRCRRFARARRVQARDAAAYMACMQAGRAILVGKCTHGTIDVHAWGSVSSLLSWWRMHGRYRYYIRRVRLWLTKFTQYGLTCAGYRYMCRYVFAFQRKRDFFSFSPRLAHPSYNLFAVCMHDDPRARNYRIYIVPIRAR